MKKILEETLVEGQEENSSSVSHQNPVMSSDHSKYMNMIKNMNNRKRNQNNIQQQTKDNSLVSEVDEGMRTIKDEIIEDKYIAQTRIIV